MQMIARNSFRLLGCGFMGITDATNQESSKFKTENMRSTHRATFSKWDREERQQHLVSPSALDLPFFTLPSGDHNLKRSLRRRPAVDPLLKCADLPSCVVSYVALREVQSTPERLWGASRRTQPRRLPSVGPLATHRTAQGFRLVRTSLWLTGPGSMMYAASTAKW